MFLLCPMRCLFISPLLSSLLLSSLLLSSLRSLSLLFSFLFFYSFLSIDSLPLEQNQHLDRASYFHKLLPLLLHLPPPLFPLVVNPRSVYHFFFPLFLAIILALSSFFSHLRNWHRPSVNMSSWSGRICLKFLSWHRLLHTVLFVSACWNWLRCWFATTDDRCLSPSCWNWSVASDSDWATSLYAFSVSGPKPFFSTKPLCSWPFSTIDWMCWCWQTIEETTDRHSSASFTACWQLCKTSRRRLCCAVTSNCQL